MSKKNAKLIDKCIKHWETMLKWSQNQCHTCRPDWSVMEGEIDMSWFGEYCSLCDAYAEICSKCPLSKIAEECESIGSTWNKVCRSQTWKEWAENATKMIEVLEKAKANESQSNPPG